MLAIVCRGDCYGYELVNKISESMHITEGTIYPLLKRLKDNGSITSYIVESQEGPPRKYYQITDSGRAEKERQEQEWQEFSDSIGKLIKGEQESNHV